MLADAATQLSETISCTAERKADTSEQQARIAAEGIQGTAEGSGMYGLSFEPGH